MATYRCPTDPTPYNDPRPHDSREGMSGCGAEFEAEPDEEGFVDCLNCGLFFKPRPQDIVNDTALAVSGDAVELLDYALAALHELITANDGMAVEADSDQTDLVEYRTLDSRRDAVVQRYNALRNRPVEDRYRIALQRIIDTWEGRTCRPRGPQVLVAIAKDALRLGPS